MRRQSIASFRKIVWQFYKTGKRKMPWRNDLSAYSIIVSEIMLQQTQLARVVPKYTEFLHRFPRWKSLARATNRDILRVWSGLGYNRRALALKQIAITVGKRGVPTTQKELEKLPGIGPNTAGAIIAYVYNSPSIFIETNIRTVFLHHFFPDQRNVNDKEILALVQKTVDTEHPREWYWALMDYGAHLKSHLGNNAVQSASYRKQPPLRGSIREARGAILRHLTRHNTARAKTISQRSDIELPRITAALRALVSDKMVRRRGQIYMIA